MFSQAGIFRDGAAAGNMGAEEGDEGSGGRREEAVEISSETSGALMRCSRSTEDDIEGEGEHDDDDVEEEEEEEDGQNEKKKKKRKKYHRHTAEQIREMEAYVYSFSLLSIFNISFSSCLHCLTHTHTQ